MFNKTKAGNHMFNKTIAGNHMFNRNKTRQQTNYKKKTTIFDKTFYIN